MTKATILIAQIEKFIDDYETNDFHCIISVMITCSWYGRTMNLKQNSAIINQYFQYSPEVFEIVKEYSPTRLLIFLERIVRLCG